MTNEDLFLGLVPACLAVGTFCAAALVGHIASNKPLSQNGKRPMGKGVLTYFLNHVTSGTGVKGYDSILGAFSPPLHIMFHLALSLLFYSAGISLLAINPRIHTKIENSIYQCETHIFPNSAYFPIYLVIYVFLCFLVGKFSRGVSHPGGPRKHRIRRSPKWNDKITYIDQCDDSHMDGIKWHCDVSTQSHAATAKRFIDANPKPAVAAVSSTSRTGMKGETITLGLTGEADGRDTWSWTKSSFDEKETSKIDENLVQTMALGGRPKGFNPSVNPNR